ncbi:hypothetical protein PanWU01x14_212480, partial [Parasponia andersonii]
MSLRFTGFTAAPPPGSVNYNQFDEETECDPDEETIQGETLAILYQQDIPDDESDTDDEDDTWFAHQRRLVRHAIPQEGDGINKSSTAMMERNPGNWDSLEAEGSSRWHTMVRYDAPDWYNNPAPIEPSGWD